MYLLALDESGTHGTAPVLVIAGLAVHEHDVRSLTAAFEAVLETHLRPLGLNPDDFELHATEIKTPRPGCPATATRAARRPSPWLTVPAPTRLAVLTNAYKALTAFTARDPGLPPRVFGSIVDRRNKTSTLAERHAYDHVLHRFDEMLQRLPAAGQQPQAGIVVHDRNRYKERTIQDLAVLWQRTGARLDTLAHVPLFIDSRASRLVQAADLVTNALWRQYGLTPPDSSAAARLWPVVDSHQGVLAGVIHLTPSYRTGTCTCLPCTSRRTGL